MTIRPGPKTIRKVRMRRCHALRTTSPAAGVVVTVSVSCSARRIVVVLLSRRSTSRKSWTEFCEFSPYPSGDEWHSRITARTPYADERTRLAGSKSLILLDIVHGSSLRDPSHTPLTAAHGKA